MATSYTSLLGLALPVTGELQGTWGTTVNDSITSLLDTAVAGTTTLSTDGDVTLSTTTGAANQARQAILLCSGARTAQRTITAPAQSKIYTVINATTGGFSVKLVGVGPTTGITVVPGESALVAWNGSDFIKVSNTGGTTTFTNVTVSGTTTLSGLTASTALALDASKNVVSVTNTGTGNNVLSASPTLTGTISAAAATLSSDLTLSGGTANGVVYLNGSKVATSGSALTFDGAKLNNSSGSAAGIIQSTDTAGSGNFVRILADASFGSLINFSTGSSLRFATSADNFGSFSEQMRLDSSGNLGLGVTPSAWNSSFRAIQLGGGASFWNGGAGVASTFVGNNYFLNASGNRVYIANGTAAEYAQLTTGAHVWYTAPSGTAGNAISFGDAKMTLDASGYLLVGATSSAGVGAKRLQIGSTSQATSQLLIQSTTTHFGIYASSTADAYLTAASGSNMIFGNGPADGSTFSERARITSGGDLLVGTTSTESGVRLWVANSAAQFNWTKTSNSLNAAYIGVRDTGEAQISSSGAYSFTMWTNGSERARITSGGDLLVGTTDAGATTGVGVKTVVSATIPAVFTVFNTAGGGNAYNFYNTNATNNGYRFYVKVDGGIANYQANDLNLSDIRKKTDIQPAGSYLDKICAIPVKTFLYKDQSDTERNLGVIAQDVDAVAPELVDRNGFGETPEGESPYLSIYQTDLQYALMKCIQEQQALITDLRARVAALEAK